LQRIITTSWNNWDCNAGLWFNPKYIEIKATGNSHGNIAHATSHISKRNIILTVIKTLTVIKNFILKYKRINQNQFFYFFLLNCKIKYFALL